MFYGLTPLGVVHTAIGLVAVTAGLIALVRDRQISRGNTLGQVYIWATVLTCLTSFGIFQHDGFGRPHMLGILTLIVLGVAFLAGRSALFGRAGPYVETVSYSATFLLQMIPGTIEATTRLPPGAPLFSGPEAQELQVASGVMFLIFLIGAMLQVRRMQAKHLRSTASSALH